MIDDRVRQMREYAWILIGAIGLTIVASAMKKAGGGLSDRQNSTLFLSGIAVMGGAIFVFFRLPTGVRLSDQLLVGFAFLGGIVLFLLSDGIPGLGRGAYLSAPLVIGLITALLGMRRSG